MSMRTHSLFDGLELRHTIEICPVPTSEVKLRECVEQILGDNKFVPFELDNVEYYRETDELEPMHDQSYDYGLQSQHDLVSRITDFLFCTMNKFSQAGGENLAISLTIRKLVMIPDHEFQAWTSWYKEQKRLNPDGFEKEYHRAISVPRTVHELLYESSLLGYESAADSFIESLEKLKSEELVGDSEKISCTICLEELGKGEELMKLPCSHVFHGDCLVRCLKTNHFCPLCRYMFPTS